MLNAIVTATGMKGSGKTTKVRALVQPCRRAIFADPEGKWLPRPGDAVVYGSAQLREYIGDVGATDPRVPFGVVYRDDADMMGTTAPAIAFTIRNVTLCTDEYAWFMKPQYIPPYYKRIIQFGRERRVNLVGTTREPQEVHDLLFSQADLLLIFHTEEGNGLDRLRRRYRALAEMAPRLRNHEYQARGDERIAQLFGREGLALPSALLQPYPVHKTTR